MSENHTGAVYDAFFAIVVILIGCISNNVTLEMIIREDPEIGNLLTLLQFFFIAACTACWHIDLWSLKIATRTIPIAIYAAIAVIFFSLSVINNGAFAFDISQPVHMVFRSSSLLSNLILGYAFFGKRYSFNQVIGVICVTIGIIIVTSAEATMKSRLHVLPQCTECDPSVAVADIPTTKSSLTRWLIGLTMLLVALFMSSLLGHLQEWSYAKFGKNWKEGLFYTHLLGIPGFVLFAGDIHQHVNVCNHSELVYIGEFSIPIMWIYLLLNLITQLVCILGVYMLTSIAGTLTCTLTITLRKFVSLIISIGYFRNPFTFYHWVGSSLVFFFGSFIYADMWKSNQKQLKQH